MDILARSRKALSCVFKRIRKRYDDPRFILIADFLAMKVISNIFTMSELIERGILLVEQYDKLRQPVLSAQAIYILSDSSDFRIFLTEFVQEPMYSAPHLIFLYEISDVRTSYLIEYPQVLQRVNSCVDMYMQLIPRLPWFFYGGLKTHLGFLFNTLYDEAILNESREITKSLVSFCFTTKVIPKIAFHQNVIRMKSLVDTFQNVFSNILLSIGDDRLVFRSDTTLFVILPRNFDLISPLIHSFSYQSLLYDMCDVKNDSVEMSGEIFFLCPLTDKLYKKIMFLPIEEAHRVVESLDASIQENETKLQILLSVENPETIKSQAALCLKKPQMQYPTLSYHRALIERILTEIKNRDLLDVHEWEQALVTRSDPSRTGFAELSFTISNPRLTESDKARILALYQLSNKKCFNTRSLLQNNALPSHFMNIVNNLNLIGSLDERKMNFYESESSNQRRYKPNLISLIENSLLPGSVSSSLTIPDNSKMYRNIVVYIVGGVSHYEVAELDRFMKARKVKNIVLGGTSVTTPEKMIKELASLNMSSSV